MKNFKTLFTIALTAVSAYTSSVDGCTGIQLKQKDGSHVRGRTLEFGFDIKPSTVVVPRGYSFTTTTSNGPGFDYKAKYGVVGAICFGVPLVMDGLNEKGLSVGTFWFPDFATYTPTTAENQTKSLSPLDFPNWLLTQFATVDEVKEGVKGINISPLTLKEWGPNPPPMHWAIFDKSGKGIVIEPTDGQLKVYDNPIGVLTNDPDFDWHLLNLRNYVNLTPKNAKPVVINGFEIAPLGEGSGLVGMPGDFTPPSRFVRATVFASTIEPADTSEGGIFKLLHLLNQFDIPLGTIRGTVNGVEYMDYTMITTAYDPTTLKYYFRTYNDQAVRFLDLSKFDLDAKEIKHGTMSGTPSAQDASSTLK
jgi:choloylglycine hydrolase